MAIPAAPIHARKRAAPAATEIVPLRCPQFPRPQCRRVLMAIREVVGAPSAIPAAVAHLADVDKLTQISNSPLVGI